MFALALDASDGPAGAADDRTGRRRPCSSPAPSARASEAHAHLHRLLAARGPSSPSPVAAAAPPLSGGLVGVEASQAGVGQGVNAVGGACW